MDSSNSQHSHPQPANSTSDPGHGSASSYNGSGSGSAGSTSPSAKNSAPQGDNSSTSMQSKSSTSDQPEVEEDMDLNMADITTRGITEGKAEEIALLVDLYNLHNKTGRYLFSGRNPQRDFYKFWIKEEKDYANRKELDEKINELHERFLKNMDKDVKDPIDPIDIEIFRLSEWIWGHEIDSCEGTDDDDDDQEKDSKDLLDVNLVDDKDPTKETGGISCSKDLLSKAKGNGAAAS